MNSGVMLGLLAETFVHPGSGQTDGAIDLRVARESITGYPFVPGSAMKGALKTHFEDKNAFLEEEDRLNVTKVFGKADDAGHVLVSDARLVLLPVRSLSMPYVWLTCPLILERLCRDWKRLGLDAAENLAGAIEGMPMPGPEQMVCTEVDAGQQVFLEERLVETCGDIDKRIMVAVQSLIPEGRTRDRLPNQLGIVADATFAWFARNALPVQARNKLLPSTKASDALWYEESLAPDTMMAVTLSPRGGTSDGFSDLEAKVPDLKYLQVGGNETVGQGWMAVTRFDPKPSAGAKPAATGTATTGGGDPMTRLLDQKRAAHAHAAAKAIASERKDIWEEYRRRARSLPADIVTNGLGQALATLHKNANDDDAFKKRAYQTLIKDINDWFAAYPDSPMRGDTDLLIALVARDQGFYVWAQEESLLYLGWLKKLTEAYCVSEAPGTATSQLGVRYD